MKEALQQLIERHQPLPGLAAWSAQIPGEGFASHAYTDWFTPEHLQRAVQRLALAVDTFGTHGIATARLCWVFERARVHVALRPDGAALALFVENRIGLPSAGFEAVLEEFAPMPSALTPPAD